LSSYLNRGAHVLVAAEVLGRAHVAAVEVEHRGDGAVADAVGPALDLDPLAEPAHLPVDGGRAQALGPRILPADIDPGLERGPGLGVQAERGPALLLLAPHLDRARLRSKCPRSSSATSERRRLRSQSRRRMAQSRAP
jgi:hypothetical protein